MGFGVGSSAHDKLDATKTKLGSELSVSAPSNHVDITKVFARNLVDGVAKSTGVPSASIRKSYERVYECSALYTSLWPSFSKVNNEKRISVRKRKAGRLNPELLVIGWIINFSQGLYYSPEGQLGVLEKVISSWNIMKDWPYETRITISLVFKLFNFFDFFFFFFDYFFCLFFFDFFFLPMTENNEFAAGGGVLE